MKLGYVTDYGAETLNFAARAGFGCLELFADRGGPLDLDRLTPSEFGRIAETLAVSGLSVSAISCNPRHLAADAVLRDVETSYFRKALGCAREFGTRLVVTNAFCDTGVSMDKNLETYRTVFSEYAEYAQKCGVRIAIENCPHFTGGNPYSIGNLGFSPETFEAMFEAVPSSEIGIEFDPSHLLWQGIDIFAMLERYRDRVFAVHAKDCEILRDKLAVYGIFGRQLRKPSPYDMGWWRYRIPGFGEVDFEGILSALREYGYSGDIVIEHEDPVFGAGRSEERNAVNVMREGLLEGKKYIDSIINKYWGDQNV